MLFLFRPSLLLLFSLCLFLSPLIDDVGGCCCQSVSGVGKGGGRIIIYCYCFFIVLVLCYDGQRLSCHIISKQSTYPQNPRPTDLDKYLRVRVTQTYRTVLYRTCPVRNIPWISINPKTSTSPHSHEGHYNAPSSLRSYRGVA